jgi:MFS family permease
MCSVVKHKSFYHIRHFIFKLTKQNVPDGEKQLSFYSTLKYGKGYNNFMMIRQNRTSTTTGKIWNYGFILIFLVNILTATSFSMMLPTLPKFVMVLGFSPTITGLVSTMFVITSILTRPWTGFLANTRNLKYILAISLAIIGCAALGYSVSTNLTSLCLFRLLHGIGWGLATTVTGTYASLCLPLDKLGQGIGIFGLTSVIASSYAPSLGLSLSELLGYPWMFRIAAILSLIGLLISFILPALQPQKKAKKHPDKIPLKHTLRSRLKGMLSVQALLPSLLVLFAVTSTSSVGTFLAIYAGTMKIQNIGIFFTVNALVLLLSRPLSGWLYDYVRKELVIYPCILLIGLTLLLISVGRTLPMFLVAAVFYGLGYGGLQPLLQAWAVKSSGIENRVSANSTFYMGLDIGTGLGSSVSGIIADATGSYSSMYLIMIIPAFLGGAIFALTSVFLKPKTKTERRDIE